MRAVPGSFSAWISTLIALAAIAGAVAVWQAVDASAKAADAGRLALQQRLEQAQYQGRYSAEAAHDVRLATRYRLTGSQLADNAADVRRWLAQFFSSRIFLDQSRQPLDTGRESNALEDADVDYLLLQPRALDESAKRLSERTDRLVGIAALFVLAVFLLTLAELTVRSRVLFFVSGLAAFMTAIAFFAWV